MFQQFFVFILFIGIAVGADFCDDGSISFNGNLTKCATEPLYFLGEFDCAFFVHDNCGGRRLGICDENPDFSQQDFQYDASAVVVREDCKAIACHGKNFTDGCTTYGPGYHNFWFSKQFLAENMEINEARGFNDGVKSAKCICSKPSTLMTPSSTPSEATSPSAASVPTPSILPSSPSTVIDPIKIKLTDSLKKLTKLFDPLFESYKNVTFFKKNDAYDVAF